MVHRLMLISLIVLLPVAAAAASSEQATMGVAPSNAAESRHEGYYYPKITSREVYKARTIVHLASAPEVATVSGRYFIKSREALPSSAARDGAAARRLWDESARLAGLAG